MVNIFFFILFSLQATALFGEVKIIGHRGSPCNAPENTLASFAKAIEAGVDYIEFDVHLTKDGIPVVVHDPLLGRTVNVCSPIGVNCLTLDQIKQYDAGILYHNAFKGEQVPTLEEVFTLVNNKVGMMIEIKTGSATDAKLAEEVMAIIKSRRNENKSIIVASFSPEVLKRVKELDSNQEILALAKYENELESHTRNNPEYFGLSMVILSEKIIASFHEKGKKIWAWTVNNESDKDSLIAMGVDGLITNRPMALRICKETVVEQFQP
jgi:glycerophosphoryl diester phosphodiesterase